MEIGSVLHAMRDPAGLPGYPRLFQALLVLTWTFHIAFVLVTLGAASLAIYSFSKRETNPDWQRLSIALTKVTKVGVSMLIVLGVAPLLFVQVIYDPEWYTANILSARWAVIFIFALIVGYCLWYAFYYANHEGAKRRARWFAIGALTLFCLDGLVMHVFSYQSILPSRWMDWYAPYGVVDTSGSALHAIQWSRFIFIMSLSAPAVGVFLLSYVEYFKIRPDYERSYLDFVRRLGRRFASYGFVLSLIPFMIWQFTNQSGLGLETNPIGWLLALAIILAGTASFRLQAAGNGCLPAGAGVLVLMLLAIWREVIRVHYLGSVGYTVADYRINLDWPSTLLFLLTFVGVGGTVGGFYITLLYRSGRVRGLYEAERSVASLGTAAVAVLVLWIAVFFAFGLVIWLRHSLVS
ncbi:MAG TPA: hypothetical protein VMT61_02540 [Candidatus Binataceae bacterium]|nr:hypothetical protein [Candidatus Binataceae bacterium]